jgi:hypothetical protein
MIIISIGRYVEGEGRWDTKVAWAYAVKRGWAIADVLILDAEGSGVWT